MPARISRRSKPVVSDAGNSDIVVPFCVKQGASMSQERLPMVKIREVLRLQAEGLKQRQIAGSVNCSRSTVQECLQRARNAGIGWPLPVDLDELALQTRLYPSKAKAVQAMRVQRPTAYSTVTYINGNIRTITIMANLCAIFMRPPFSSRHSPSHCSSLPLPHTSLNSWCSVPKHSICYRTRR
jgi:predicted DNA-binding protein (UPF0251 family)